MVFTILLVKFLFILHQLVVGYFILLLGRIRELSLIAKLSRILMALRLYLVNDKDLVTIGIGGFTKACPRNSTATSCVAKMDMITLFVRFNGRNYQSNLTFVAKFAGGIVQTGAFNDIIVKCKE